VQRSLCETRCFDQWKWFIILERWGESHPAESCFDQLGLLSMNGVYICGLVFRGFHSLLRRQGCYFFLTQKSRTLTRNWLGEPTQPRDGDSTFAQIWFFRICMCLYVLNDHQSANVERHLSLGCRNVFVCLFVCLFHHLEFIQIPIIFQKLRVFGLLGLINCIRTERERCVHVPRYDVCDLNSPIAI